MKRHLNTLYITTPGAYLAKDGEAVAVRVEGKMKLRVPILNLEGVVCVGNISVSPAALGHCADNGVGVSFLGHNGRFRARVVGRVHGNVLLRRQQYRLADDESRCLELARLFVLAKVTNCRAVLQRVLRDHSSVDTGGRVSRTADQLAGVMRRIQRAAEIDVLRGEEGIAAKGYFSVFDHLILQQKNEFQFAGRSRRPPRDRVNAVLSFLYTVLCHDQASALESVGLDSAVGFLHRDRPGRPGLALDLIEELRPYLVDRLALTMVNRRQLGPRDFRQHENGAVLLNDEGRKTVLSAYQKRKDEEVRHAFLDEKTTVGMVVHLQALLLARHLRGDLDAYPPFLMR